MQLAITDTETADIKGGICDFAAVIVDENLNVLRQYESLIDPERPISATASGIHHIVDSMVEHEPTFREFNDIYGYPLRQPDLLIGGHNIQFDIRVIGPDYLPEVIRPLCTLKLARNLWPDLPDHKLQTLRYHFRLDAGTAHRAMGDVRVCLALLRMVAEERGIGLSGLVELARKPISLDNKMIFGKHRGEKLRDIPISYVRWLLGNSTELDADLREALETRVNKTAAVA
jgi:exodeoxyribonuclease X